MIVSLATRKPLDNNSPELKKAKPDINISGNKVTIPVAEYERIKHQASFFYQMYSSAVSVMTSQQKTISNLLNRSINGN